MVKGIEISHIEAKRQENQFSVDRLNAFTVSTPALPNDYCRTSSFDAQQTVAREDIEVTIL